MAAIDIVDQWGLEGSERIRLFGSIEQMVTLLTLPTQLFLTAILINRLGVKKILFAYGVFLSLVFCAYAFHPTMGLVISCIVFLRVFEYGLNKPIREIVFSQLPRNDRYKSSVFIDTFISRLGNVSGSGFILLAKLIGIGYVYMPLAAAPLAALLSVFGIKVANEVEGKEPVRVMQYQAEKR